MSLQQHLINLLKKFHLKKDSPERNSLENGSKEGPSSLGDSFKTFLKRFFKPEIEFGIRRLQFFWLGCFAVGSLVLAYGIVFYLFYNNPIQKQAEAPKPTPTSIETASQKVGLDEVWRHTVENDYKKLADEISALKALFEESLKGPRDGFLSEDLSEGSLERDSLGRDSLERGSHDELKADKNDYAQNLESRILQLESQLEEKKKGSEGFDEASFNKGPVNEPGTSPEAGENQERKLIQKFSLGLSENPKHKQPKTVDTTIPAGAFAKTVLLSGLDASSAMNASSDPRPMLLRLIDPGTLPRRFQSDLKDCHCTASAYGDLSSERVYARLEKLTCIERSTGEIIETQVAGYIAGSDGKAGIRGVVASKDGQFLSRSLMGGVFAGLSNVANPQNRQAQVNPFFQGSSQVSPPSVGEMFTSGMAGGTTTALDRLSQYYIDRAEQLQPVIQIAAGQIVDIVFTEGTFIGSQSIKSEIEKTREDARAQTLAEPST